MFAQGFPVLKRAAKSDVKLNDNFHDNNQLAKSMITNRLDKLKYERDFLANNQGRYNHIPDVNNYYSYNNMRRIGHSLMNPFLYSYQFLDPIYYPLEIPGQGSPVALPRIEMGGPVEEKNKCCCCKGGLQTADLLLLLNTLGKLPQGNNYAPANTLPSVEPVKPIVAPKNQLESKKLMIPPLIKNKKKTKKIKLEPIKDKKKEVVDIPEPPKRKIRRDWWRLARDFVNCYLFFSTAKKYGNHFAKFRNAGISQRTKNVVQDISILKDWVIAIEEPFWNEFKIFEDLNIAFKNTDSRNKIKKETQKIVAIIKKFIENLIAKSSKLSDIPEKVEQVLYEYIKDKAYFPKKYLSTYQINRIDFEFYGSTRRVSVQQGGMILAYLIICGVAVQQILLHMRDVFLEFSNFPNIDISAKYVGSLMHYLTRDTFTFEPGMVKELYALFNYYRNYHIFNEQVEKQQDIFNCDMVFLEGENMDEYAEFLIPETDISEFWTLHEAFIETYKNFVYAWACKLAKMIKMKFSKTDPNLLPRKRLQAPKDKTVKEKENKKDDDESSD